MRPKILIAPACWKGSLSALEVGEVMRDFLAERISNQVELRVCPIADGGDDTLAVLQAANSDYVSYTQPTTGPLPSRTVQAQYLVNVPRKTIWIEAAQAHGLKLLPKGAPLSPLVATSYGVGELIRHVLCTHQPETLVVSVGGSASTDGGMGALQALGVEFLDEAGEVLQVPIGGAALHRIHRIGWPEDQSCFSWKQLLIATDVVNPLLGTEGAALVFGPQKGATPVQCQQLDQDLAHLAQLMQQATDAKSENSGKERVADGLAALPGTGAAGGLAYGLRCLPRSGIVSGSQWIAEQIGLPPLIAESQIILTGEGCLDLTSLGGKATGHLLAMAEDKPVLFFCGQARDGLTGWGQVSVYPLVSMSDASSDSSHPRSASEYEPESQTSSQAQTIAEAMVNPKVGLRRLLEQAWPKLESLISVSGPKPA